MHKKRNCEIRKPAILGLICFILCSCKTEILFLTANEPAPVGVPSYIKKVGIINASLISDSSKFRKNIDQALSAKGPNLDKDCSRENIRGLRDALMQNNRFVQIVFLDSVNIENNYPGTFPSPLSWDVIEKICQMNNVDALFVLELFHTNSKVNVAVAPTSMGGVITGVANASIVTKVNAGWRIYDPQSKTILDEDIVTQSLTFGGNPLDIATSLLNHKEAVMEVSYQLGQYYTGRILPYSIRVSREFYIKGTENFKIAKRMADAGDWDGAAGLWKQETTNPNSKIRAKAYYNMAISCEMNGDLEGAIDWAQKSYILSGKRLALQYLNILKDRKADNDILKAQTTGQ
jgi:hypothetical protein